MRCPVLCLLLFAGCAGGARGADDARAAFIVDTIIDADRDLIAERPDLVAQKYRNMAANPTNPQPFLRGTPALFYRDYSSIRGDRSVNGSGGAQLVQLYGDPHLENIGTNFDATGMLVDCTDFDATVRAPFDWEVRRAALGIATALGMGGRSDDQTAPIIDELAAAYLAALANVAAGGVAAPMRAGGLGAIFEDLLAKALKKRDARDELSDTTVGTDGVRRITRDPAGLTFVSAAPPFNHGVAQALVAYRPTRKGGPGVDAYFTVKDFARKFGSGVASFANLRFNALIEGATASVDDDLLLELKEERDPPMPVAQIGRGASSLSNGARIYAGSVLLQATEGVDADLGFVTWNNVSFQVRRETSGRRNLKVTDLADGIMAGTTTDTHLHELARVVGTLIGNAHSRGGVAADILAAAGDAARFRADTVAAARSDHARLVSDFVLFQKALMERGPLLGAK